MNPFTGKKKDVQGMKDMGTTGKMTALKKYQMQKNGQAGLPKLGC